MGNDSYYKIYGTILNITTQRPTSVYEYSNFSPIPFKSGDIFGILQPVYALARLNIVSEKDNAPINYYVGVSESPFETFFLQDTAIVKTHDEYPLVSVEISKIIIL